MHATVQARVQDPSFTVYDAVIYGIIHGVPFPSDSPKSTTMSLPLTVKNKEKQHKRAKLVDVASEDHGLAHIV